MYLRFSILDLNKIVMYEFWYENMKPKYVDNVKLCYMDTDSFMDMDTEIFMKILLMMLKKDLIHQIASATPLKSIDHYLKERIKK